MSLKIDDLIGLDEHDASELLRFQEFLEWPDDKPLTASMAEYCGLPPGEYVKRGAKVVHSHRELLEKS